MNHHASAVKTLFPACFIVLSIAIPANVSAQSAPRHITADLKVSQPQQLTLKNGKSVTIELHKLNEVKDPLRSGIRQVAGQFVINDQTVEIQAGPYSLPTKVGPFRIDIPVSSGYNANSTEDHWRLAPGADLRVRIWSADGPLSPETFVYPVRQQWFASGTQMANEPTFVDGGEDPSRQKIYYHSGLDIGGPEGLAEVVAATNGTIVSLGNAILGDLEADHPVAKRYDVIYLRDERGWYYRYSHLQQFNPSLKLGQKVTKGTSLGVLGKEGGSGGWAHLHFEIKSRQPSGKYGTEEGYAFLWEAAIERPETKIIAVARPHRLVRVGDTVELDASKSWSASGKALQYDWELGNGKNARGSKTTVKYDKPGHYSEVLKVSDENGNMSYDFAVTQVLDPATPGQLPPSIQAACWPSLGVKTSTPVTFLARTFRTTEGRENWNFGDGTPEVTVQSDGNSRSLAPDGFAATVHRFARPGHYIVKVSRSNARGETATAHLHVHVEDSLK